MNTGFSTDFYLFVMSKGFPPRIFSGGRCCGHERLTESFLFIYRISIDIATRCVLNLYGQDRALIQNRVFHPYFMSDFHFTHHTVLPNFLLALMS